MNEVIFSEIRIGQRFISPSGVTFRKVSTVGSKPVIDANGVQINRGDTTFKFFNSKILLRKL